MDVVTTFRTLVTNKYMQNYNYVRHKFSFKTLFHQSSYSYCCCLCGFEHEYINYISDDGAINEDMYQKILRCILDGKCPHVDNAPSDTYIREAKVYAIHIAAAVGTVNAVGNISRGNYNKTVEGIYCLDPLQIAVLKSQCCFVKKIGQRLKELFLRKKDFNNLQLQVGKLSYAARLRQNKDNINFEKINIPTFCIRTSNLSFLKALLDPTTFYHDTVYEDLELAYDKEVEDMQKELLAYVRELRCDDTDLSLTWCAIPAIVHEKDHDLHDILDTIKSCPNPRSNMLTRQLPTVCHIFGKHNQEAIIESFAYCFGPACMTHKMCVLHYLIKHYTKDYGKEIKAASDELFQGQEAANDENIKYGRLSLIHYCLGGLKSEVDAHHAKVLIKFGANVDVIRTFQGNSRKLKSTALEALLQKKLTKNIRNIRRILALFILENPILEINTTAVDNGINLDERFAQESNFVITDNYVMDATEHTYFSDNEFPLNFIAPLLIECGFRCSRNTLVNAQERRLHPAELEYFNHLLNNPRSLKFSCRDALRKHFKRRAIYDFLNNSDIPETIKDFILVRRVLMQSHTFLYT